MPTTTCAAAYGPDRPDDAGQTARTEELADLTPTDVSNWVCLATREAPAGPGTVHTIARLTGDRPNTARPGGRTPGLAPLLVEPSSTEEPTMSIISTFRGRSTDPKPAESCWICNPATPTSPPCDACNQKISANAFAQAQPGYGRRAA